MGIKASPTCVLSYGDAGDGAVGYLIGEENAGMRYMFTMMNNARLSVGLEGLSLAERAFQMALAYAKERRQGRAPGAPAGEQSLDHRAPRRAPDAAHPEGVHRGAARDHLRQRRRHGPRRPPPRRGRPRRRATSWPTSSRPVSKGWGTDLGVELTSLALQVFGGMGYIEETGVAQHYRDARIAPIYEGTNGIQAMDLVGRKLPMRAGGAVGDYLGQIQAHRRRAGRRPATTWRRSTRRWPTALDAAAHGHRLAPRQRPGRPARRAGRRHARTCGCSASSPAAGSWPCRP